VLAVRPVGGNCFGEQMTSWADLHDEGAELAELLDAVRARFASQVHHVLATVRADGSPRLCGTEVRWHGPDLVVASMGGSWKSRDLRRDGRLVLHSGTVDPPEWQGDARIAGLASPVTDESVLADFLAALDQPPPGSFDLFRVDVTELVLLTLAPSQEELLIRSWRAGRGLTTQLRR
jgi:hypothetical protein